MHIHSKSRYKMDRSRCVHQVVLLVIVLLVSKAMLLTQIHHFVSNVLQDVQLAVLMIHNSVLLVSMELIQMVLHVCNVIKVAFLVQEQLLHVLPVLPAISLDHLNVKHVPITVSTALMLTFVSLAEKVLLQSVEDVEAVLWIVQIVIQQISDLALLVPKVFT